MISYQKILVATLLLVFNFTIYTNYEAIPYENVIAREYNRMRGGNHYSSIQSIISQQFRGKSTEQKNQILADLRALKQAIHMAWSQAEHDGKRVWQWGYIWKDNNATIQSLREHEDDVTIRLQELEWESQSDVIKFLWVSGKYISIALASIMSLYLTQNYLSQEYYAEHKMHGPIEMILAPAYGGLEVAKYSSKIALKGIQGLGGILLLTGHIGLQSLETNTNSPVNPTT